MDKKPETDLTGETATAVSEHPAVEAGQQSRRKFTRAAVTSGAVLLTLGNRSAWGTGQEACVSAAIWTSYVNNGMAFASAHGGGTQHSGADSVEAYQQFIQDNQDHPDFEQGVPRNINGVDSYCADTIP